MQNAFTVKYTRIMSDSDNCKNVQEWTAKRNYVIAINSSLLLITISAMMIIVFILLFYLFMNICVKCHSINIKYEYLI